MSGRFEVLLLEEGKPTVERARAQLNAVITRATANGVTVLKVVHGYGSSGFGGTLRDAIRRSLRKRRKEDLIRCMVPGENWSTFDASARQVLDACPELEKDPDFNRYNEGITFVLL